MTYNDLITSHTIYLQTKTSSQNAYGNWTETYTTNTTGETCRLNPIKAEELIQLQGAYDNVKYKAYCDIDSTIDRGMRVVYNSETYKVSEVLTDSSSHHKTAFLSLL